MTDDCYHSPHRPAPRWRPIVQNALKELAFMLLLLVFFALWGGALGVLIVLLSAVPS